ncbi:hypothetical protein JP75_01190 [Devosia riboflavina]|uniref:DUF945 domain-containing protein n=1 Tax=Devosia riboflavina TaxID=46914 RepID=A0A087M7D9_9HYPH|nr:hypothetical protein [Devosia riboflavina]KFL32792.1 hypothetical protein JP75_01190 [Devosia riboflavina]
MMRINKIQGLMLASGMATLALMQPAMALDAQTFVDRIAAVYKIGGYDIQFGAATLDGDTITVDGATVGVTGVEEPWTVDTTLTFTGVAEGDDGSFTADALTIPDIDTEFAQDPVGHVSLVDITATDIYLPPEDKVNVTALLESVGSLTTGPLSVTRDGTEVISYESIEAVNEFSYDDANALTDIASTFAVNGIWADLSTVSEEDAEAGAVIQALGLTEINGNISQTMTWGMTDGHLVIEDFLFDFADIGAINFKADISGLTPAVLEKIYAMDAASTGSTPEEQQAQQMMVGMELLQALTLTGSSLRYDDAGLAPKLLDMFAAQSGADRATFVEGLKAMVPQLVGQAGIPALTDLVTPAANAFLDDPKSIEVAVRPATPTTLLVLSAAAANPAGLISALGLAVTANQPSAE